MKISEKLAKQIIKEEVIKVKKLIVLQNEKKAILKQLNELYEVETCEEVMKEEESILDLIPDANDKATVQKDIQQAQQPQIQQPTTTLEEGIGGKILNKIQSIVFSKPDELNKAVAELPDEYVGKSFPEIYQMVKQKISPSLEEGLGVNTFEAIAKYANGFFKTIGSIGTASLIGAIIETMRIGHEYGLPTTLAQIGASISAVAIISGLIYVIANAKAEKMRKA